MTTDDKTIAGGAGPIAFQGEPGAYSDMACRALFPGVPTLPCNTFEDALNAIVGGVAAMGVIPIENSLAGRVADVYHLLPRMPLKITAEHFQPVHHHLLALPGVAIGELRRVASHIHALGQCRTILRELGVKVEVASDTAGAAKALAKSRDRGLGVLASSLAGSLYGLQSLRADVEDEAHNTTRFLVLAREAVSPPFDAGLFVTTLIFRVRNVPAALYKAMGGFATNGINITKLESYLIDGSFSATGFYADVEAHPDERRMRLALEELEFFSSEVMMLGTYRGHDYRSSDRNRGTVS